VCFAPVEEPRYAAAVVIEHGLGGARAAAPVAKDVLTFLYDRDKAMAALTALESGWGGTIEERMARSLNSFNAPPPPPISQVDEASTAATAAPKRSSPPAASPAR
jgi:hypothetical protein